MGAKKQEKLLDLIDTYVFNKILWNDTNKIFLMVSHRINNKEYLIGKKFIDYIDKTGYEKRKKEILLEYVQQDLNIKKNCIADIDNLNKLLQSDYQKIYNILLTLTKDEFTKICMKLEEEIDSLEHSYITGINLEQSNEEYLRAKKIGYQEILFHLKAIFNSTNKNDIKVLKKKK